MEMALLSVPDFGDVIYRQRLVSAFERRAPGLTVVCAPAGYGKSVLASQFARLPRFDHAIWVSVEGHAAAGSDVLGYVCHTLTHAESSRDGRMSTTLPVASSAATDMHVGLREGLKEHEGSRLCVVVDGVEVMQSLDEFRELSSVLCTLTSNTTRLVVTCRRVASGPDNPAGVWCIEESDLRFREAEVRELLASVGFDDGDVPVIRGLLERSGGQAALLSMMAMHEESIEGGLGEVPKDLVWYLNKIVASLDDSLIRATYCAALLRAGKLSDVEAIVDLGSEQWTRLAAAVPLLSLSSDESALRVRFTVHALLADVLGEIAERRLPSSDIAALRSQVLHLLGVSGDHLRLVELLVTRCSAEERVEWCERLGTALLASTGPGTIAHCLELIPASMVAPSAKLLLLWAAVLRQQERLSEALEKARIARQTSENRGDWAVQIDSSLLIARLALDTGDFRGLETVLRPLESCGTDRMSPAAQCLLQAYLSVVDAQEGRVAQVRERERRVLALLRRVDASSEPYVFAINVLSGIHGVCWGHWAETARLLQPLVGRKGVAPAQRHLVRANLHISNMQLGRLEGLSSSLRALVQELRELRSTQLLGCAIATTACVMCAAGETDSASDLQAEAVDLANEIGDSAALSLMCADWACVMRAVGRGQAALASAELGAATASSVELPLLALAYAQVELAASLLYLGDRRSAVERVSELRSELVAGQVNHHLLATDMVLAEVDRIEGRFEEACDRIRQHADYIRSESANWQVAMYIRAFPGLLDVFSTAIGLESLPAHMVRLIPLPSTTDGAESPSRAALDDRLCAGLRQTDASADDVPACRVTLFGGLHVRTEYASLDERSWRKRRARQIFAMLAVRHSQDIPRDVIFERLWPDMDERSARANFYVAWSTLRSALTGKEDSSLAARYIQHAGGTCRLTDAVSSDLRDFDSTLTVMRGAAGSGDGSTVLRCAWDIAELYRGELLPGDVYDDWFTEVRDRTRQDFCDAMMLGVRAACENGDHDQALALLRRASSADPWREDVYQAMMRCQAESGQRSRAIETYLACRSKLVEDLGIDPSAETTQLYQAIIAMDQDGDLCPEQWPDGFLV